MNIASALTVPLRAPHATLGPLDPTSAARLAEAAGDLVLILEPDGTIIDFSIASHEPPIEGSDDWTGQNWSAIVTAESRAKVTDMLKAAAAGTPPRWRQVNHPTSTGDVPVRYWAIASGNEGRVIAVGRDLRANAVLQQRLMQVQQSLERDYLRLRQAESRYRMLFERASEAILIVDADTRRIREANPAVALLLGMPEGSLISKPLTVIGDPGAADTLLSHLGAVSVAEQPPMTLTLAAGRGSIMLSASMFRQDQASYYLIRLGGDPAVRARAEGDAQLLDMLARMPDAFVIADGDLKIIAANPAFIDLAQMASIERVRGQRLSNWVGRTGIDLDLILVQMREHGVARNVATVVRAADGTPEEVEISGVSAPGSDGPTYGFTMRAVARRARDLPPAQRDLPRSVEQLTELVGRMSLKEIVRESTDLIERLCIEAALVHTADNRASAAEILGVSRQSLYSKLHRHGLGNLGGDGDEE